MDMEWSTVLEWEHPWYHGVTLYTISRRAAHNSNSYQRYLDGLDLANFVFLWIVCSVAVSFGQDPPISGP